MRACLLLLLAAALAPARAVPALRASSSSHLHAAPRVAQSTCDTCLDVARDFEQYLVDPKTQDAVVSFVQDNICSLLPPDAGATCAQEARVAVAQAVASITQTLTPQMVCDYLGVCQAAGPGAAADARLAGGPVECPLCKLVFAQLVARLQDPTSRADIQRSAQEACQDLEGAAAVTKCLGDVAQLFAAVDALLDDVDAHRACQVAQFCGAADGAAAAERAPSPGVAALRALGSRLAALSSDSCDECKSVIAQAAATLEVR